MRLPVKCFSVREKVFAGSLKTIDMRGAFFYDDI
jgi:hypothetical protein